ncbi:hypothetical protein PC111_g16347 [Phytophthora cactorum]|nr:hypothetical protein PC111_g16347 [Phytophthora cactorum]
MKGSGIRGKGGERLCRPGCTVAHEVAPRRSALNEHEDRPRYARDLVT